MARGSRIMFRVEGETEDTDDPSAGPELLLELLVRTANEGTCPPAIPRENEPCTGEVYCPGSCLDVL